MNYSLVKAVLNDTWSISLQYYLQFQHIADAILSGIHFEMEDNTLEPFSQLFDLESATYVQPDGKSTSDKGFVAVHSVRGIMLKYDTSCGPVGTRTIAQSILAADRNPEVRAHVVAYDTGGGQSTSVSPLKEVFQKASKPVVSFIDGNCHSAGIFSAVFSKEIIALPGSFAGSIGTFISLEGMPKNHTDKDGKVYRRIYATTSGKKNQDFEEALKGNDAPIQKSLLDPHDKDFMDSVRSNRPNVTDEQLEGGMFQVENLVGTLVDALGDLDFAIQRAVELAEENEDNSENSNNNQNSTSMAKQFLNVNQTIGVESLEASEEGVFLNQEQLESLDNALAADPQPEPAADPEPEPEPASEEVVEDPRDARIEELEAQVATLNAAPAADPDPAKSNDGSQSGKSDNFLNEVAAAKKLQEEMEGIE